MEQRQHAPMLCGVGLTMQVLALVVRACRVGECAVQLRRDLSTVAKAGDPVLVGGETHKDVVRRNFTHRKLGKVDFTFRILGAKLGGSPVSIGLYFASETTAETLPGGHALAFLLLPVGVPPPFFSRYDVCYVLTY